MLIVYKLLFFNCLGKFDNLVSLIFESETSFIYTGPVEFPLTEETPFFNIYLTLQNTLIHFWDYLKHKIFPFLKKFSRKIKIFTLLIINQLHLYKQPYTLIDIKEWAYEKIFADSVVTVHRPLQYCGVRFEKRISS